MKTVCIVSNFFNYTFDLRVKYLYEYFKQKGCKVYIVTSDFDHRTKNYFCVDNSDAIVIHTMNYKRNMSLDRMLSHYLFAKAAYRKCVLLCPDVVYVLTPPNCLFYFFSRFKKNCHNKITKIYYDVWDLWPETIPLGKNLKLVLMPLFYLWKLIRNYSLSYNDNIFFECKYFLDYLKVQNNLCNCDVLYLKKDNKLDYLENLKISNTIDLLYLGSINNLLDIDFMLNILQVLKSKYDICLHIIGNGEKLDRFTDLLKKDSIKFIKHGMIFDEKEKLDIISNCHFALNIMKKSVFVGLTMKSLDYFYYGIPIINNIRGDSMDIIEKYNCGFNVDENSYKKIIKLINNLTDDSYSLMRENARKVYLEIFSSDKIYDELDIIDWFG